MLKKLFLGVGMALLATSISGAKADTISIGWSSTMTGTVTPLASGSGAASTGIVSITGTSFTTNSISGTGSPPLPLPSLLNSSSMNLSSSDGGTIFIWVTESDIALPSGGSQLFSTVFTSNNVIGNTTLTMQTFYDAGDGVFTAVTPLGPAQSFTTPGTATDQASVALTGSSYSVTALYEISTIGVGGVNATIDVSVPGPIVGAGLPGLLAACGGLIALARRRRREFT